MPRQLEFGGEVAELYARFRRGYSSDVLEVLRKTFGLRADSDVAIDLGCGTGQVTLPLARHVSAVIGVDPEPDMLAQAVEAARQADVRNIAWLLGSDASLPTLEPLLGQGRVGVLAIGQALHWMDAPGVFRAALPLLRPGGGIAILTNGTPLWQQDSEWSAALARFLQNSYGWRLVDTCGSDEVSERRYLRELESAGFSVSSSLSQYEDGLTPDQLVGALLSTFPAPELPPPAERDEFARRVLDALPTQATFTEHIDVKLLLGVLR